MCYHHSMVSQRSVSSSTQAPLAKVVLSGSIAFDRIMVFPGTFAEVIQPEKLHVLSLSVLLDDLKETRGGVAANIAYNLALLGDAPVLYGSVGENARSYMKDLGERGVDVSKLHYSDKPTATFTVMTDRDDCQIGGFYPGAMFDASSLTLEPFKDQDVLVVVSPHDLAQSATQVSQAKTFGLRLLYDVGQQAAILSADDLQAGIEAAEVVIANDYEWGLIEKKSGWSRQQIVEKVRVAIVTLGAEGSLVYVDGQESQVGAVSLTKDQVQDPTGAGDAFRAGFLHGYIRDWEVTKCVQLASVVASYAIQKKGTQEHEFEVDQVEKLVKKTYS